MNRGADNDFAAGRERWTIFGAGRLGLGVLAPLANELDMSSLLVVAGENTSPEKVARYNDESNYRVTSDKSPHETMVSDYRFVTRSDVREIIDSIADLDTRVISTSVGEDRLPEVLPILVAGLRERIAKHGSDAEATGLVLLICENGRGPDGQPRAVGVREELREMMRPDDLDAIVEMPIVVMDSIVPLLPDKNLNLSVSVGDIWMEETPSTRDLFSSVGSVHLDDAEALSLIHTRKLYCVNTMHLLLSVAGAIAGEETINRIATDPKLKRHWAKVCESLATATCEPGEYTVTDVVGGFSTIDYAKRALKRMQWPSLKDEVDRAMGKLRLGWYLDDGRIDGPVADAGLVAEPDRHPALVHAIALALHSVVDSINALALQFACVPSEIPGQTFEQSAKRNFASGLALALESPFTDNPVRTPLVEALARDFQWLNDARTLPLSTTMMAKFLARPISRGLRALPRHAGDIRCVMFDLDEGLVATESLLYRVTREMIEKQSHDNLTLTHDEYAEHVGSPEADFFRKMINVFQIQATTPENLVAEREDLFVETLEEVNSQILLKPGFRSLLELLADREVAMAVCSNASRGRVEATLEHAGISNYFQEVITPSAGFPPKGSSGGTSMYEEVRHKLGHDPEECVVVESSLVGVTTAVAAGLYTLLVVNDYTQPKRAARAGVHVLGNAQMLQAWFSEHFERMPVAA
ncbi:MAG TPA: HAD hydrolase-like protein [Solirubrobacterales bacterium]|nr:HAD hydrolase-like protein [Solirubrobacterales bacterium]